MFLSIKKNKYEEIRVYIYPGVFHICLNTLEGMHAKHSQSCMQL